MRRKSSVRQIVSSLNWSRMVPWLCAFLGGALLVCLLAGCDMKRFTTSSDSKSTTITPTRVQYITQIAAGSYLLSHKDKVSKATLASMSKYITEGLSYLDSKGGEVPINPFDAVAMVTQRVQDPTVNALILLGLDVIQSELGEETLKAPNSLEVAKPYVASMLKGLKIAIDRYADLTDAPVFRPVNPVRMAAVFHERRGHPV